MRVNGRDHHQRAENMPNSKLELEITNDRPRRLEAGRARETTTTIVERLRNRGPEIRARRRRFRLQAEQFRLPYRGRQRPRTLLIRATVFSRTPGLRANSARPDAHRINDASVKACRHRRPTGAQKPESARGHDYHRPDRMTANCISVAKANWIRRAHRAKRRWKAADAGRRRQVKTTQEAIE